MLHIAPARRMLALHAHLFVRLNRRKAELRAAGVDVISLDMGSPDLSPASHIVEALVRGARRLDRYGYGEFGGSLAVKRAFADFYAQRFGVMLDPEREVLLSLGSKEGIYHIVDLAVLAERRQLPLRVSMPSQEPLPLPYLRATGDQSFDIHLAVD